MHATLGFRMRATLLVDSLLLPLERACMLFIFLIEIYGRVDVWKPSLLLWRPLGYAGLISRCSRLRPSPKSL